MVSERWENSYIFLITVIILGYKYISPTCYEQSNKTKQKNNNKNNNNISESSMIGLKPTNHSPWWLCENKLFEALAGFIMDATMPTSEK